MRPFVTLALLGLVAVGPACASSRRARPESPPRIKDSVPEKVAAQRAAQSNLRLEPEDERWGIDAARERKSRKGSADAAASAARTPPPTSAVDLRPASERAADADKR